MKKVLYANSKSKVGSVEVYSCPHCRDGREIESLRSQLEVAQLALAWYADENNYRLQSGALWGNSSMLRYLIDENGDKARAALEGKS